MYPIERLFRLAPFLFLFLLSPPPTHAQVDQEVPPTLALTKATVIDGTGAAPVPDRTIVIRDGQIAAILDARTADPPEGARIVDLAGQYVIPGLIDSKVNLARYPYGEDRREVVEPVLEEALYRGVTSVRDLGGDARELAVLARDATVGEIASPDIHYSAGMSGPSFFESYPMVQTGARGGVAGQMPWSRAITEETDLRQAVAEAKGTGASAIMIFADLSPSLVRQITEEAHRQDLQVWAQAAVYPAGPGDVISAGVDAISHLTGLFTAVMDEMPASFAERRERGLGDVKPADLKVTRREIAALIQQMRAEGTVFDPVVWRSRFLENTSANARRQLALYCDYARAVKEAGVPTSVGTSEGHQIRVPEATELLVTGCGFTPLEAIRSATLHGAMAIGIEETHGSVAVGKRADLVVLGSDPTENIRNLRDVELVLKDGAVYEPDNVGEAAHP